MAVVETDRVIVMRGGERLKGDQMLLDLPFPYDAISDGISDGITVTCPEDAISFRVEIPPLELDPDFFSMFEHDSN